jgi:hypothetical protein
MPMPPWSCTDSWLTWRALSAILILAAETARARSLRHRSLSRPWSRRAGHRARLLLRDEHVDHAVLQRLEGADRHAELLARLEVLERGVAGELHRADRLGADERGGEVGQLPRSARCRLRALGLCAAEETIGRAHLVQRA